jgi:hypothetical protein
MLKYYIPIEHKVKFPIQDLSRHQRQIKCAHTVLVQNSEIFTDENISMIKKMDIPSHVMLSVQTTGLDVSEDRVKSLLDHPNVLLKWNNPDKIISCLFDMGPKQRLVFCHKIDNPDLKLINQMIDLSVEQKVDWIEFDVHTKSVKNKNACHFVEAQKFIMERCRDIGVYVSFVRNLALRFADPPKWTEIKPVKIREELISLSL